MTLDSALYGGLLGDPETARILSDAAEIAAMVRVEKALARVEADLGIIPPEAATGLIVALDAAFVDPGALAADFERDGMIAPGLIGQLKQSIPPEIADYLHWGATSQDVSDLALVLRLAEVLDLFASRLETVIAALADLAEAHRETVSVAHTRGQQAAPTLFGLKCANWLQPLLRHRTRLREMRPRLLAVQLGGGAGTLQAFGDRGIAVMEALADELGLARAEPWHSARDRIEEFASLLAMIAASLGRMGADFMLLAQNEIGEIAFVGAGGSSTLPQKQNPVIAEILVALARHAAGQAAALHYAAIHPTERDGAALTLEWLALPALIGTTGTVLLKAEQALGAIRPDAARMRRNLEATRGLVLAEAASFALAQRMPRREAMALVKQAAARVAQEGGTLMAALETLVGPDAGLEALSDAMGGLGSARELIDRIVKAARDQG